MYAPSTSSRRALHRQTSPPLNSPRQWKTRAPLLLTGCLPSRHIHGALKRELSSRRAGVGASLEELLEIGRDVLRHAVRAGVQPVHKHRRDGLVDARCMVGREQEWCFRPNAVWKSREDRVWTWQDRGRAWLRTREGQEH